MLRHCWRLCSCVLRCGRDTLLQGELQASLLHESSETMLNVHTEQEKSAYLRGFTGGKYENGTWKPLPDAACGGENIGMLDWLQTQGLDPFTQSAAYYRLTGDAPEANTVEVSVQNASRDAVYAPASMEKVTDGDVHERRDALLKGRGLFGTRNYTVIEVSGTRPSELMVAESWVSSRRPRSRQPMRKQSRSIAALCMMHIPQRTRNCCLCSTVCSGRIMMMKMTAFTVRSAASARC